MKARIFRFKGRKSCANGDASRWNSCNVILFYVGKHEVLVRQNVPVVFVIDNNLQSLYAVDFVYVYNAIP